MATLTTRRLFTVDEYYKMAEAGILGEDDRVELIEGEIVEMPPIGPPHASCVARLIELLSRGLGGRAIVWPQNPLRLNDRSEPQPDITLVRRRPDFYAAAHPRPEDVLLVVEVADTSIAYDRDVKAALYARAGVPEVWLVDLNQGSISVYLDPGPDGFRSLSEIRGSDQVSPQAFPQFVLTANQIFGRPDQPSTDEPTAPI